MSIILDHKLIFIHVPTTNKPQNFFGTPNDSSFRPFFSLLGTWLFSYGRNWTVAYSCYNSDLSVCLQPSSWCWQWGTVVGHCISWKFRGASVTPPLVRSVHTLTSCLYTRTHMHTLTHTLHAHSHIHVRTHIHAHCICILLPRLSQKQSCTYLTSEAMLLTEWQLGLALFPGLPCFYLLFAFTFPLFHSHL